MSLKINYNVSAMIANNSLKLNDNKLTTSLGKLSSGYKINSAKDDAAGLAISRRMHAQLKGLKAASQDAKDGVSVIEIADGALAEVHDILQRMNELSVKSANGTLMDGDRDAIQQEIAQKYGLQVIDLHTLFAADADKMLDDGIHPDGKGARRIAEIVAEAIK